MSQCMDTVTLMVGVATMLGLSGLGAVYEWRNDREWWSARGIQFLQLWFQFFSKWLGYVALFGLSVFLLTEHPTVAIIAGVVFWAGVLVLVWAARRWKD